MKNWKNTFIIWLVHLFQKMRNFHQLWAQDTIDGERTTNTCESFHVKFNASFSAPSPIVYASIQVIKQTQAGLNALKISVNIIKQPNKFLKKGMEKWSRNM